MTPNWFVVATIAVTSMLSQVSRRGQSASGKRLGSTLESMSRTI